MLMGTTCGCSNCGLAGFGRFRDDTPWLPDRDQPLRCRHCAAPHEEYAVTVSRRPLQSKRHVRNFFAEGHEVLQVAGPDGKPPVVYSRGEMQRLWEKNGLDPDTGAILPYGDGGEKFN